MPKGAGNGMQSRQCESSTCWPTPGSSADDSNVDGGLDSDPFGNLFLSALLTFSETEIPAFFTFVGDEDAALLSRAWLDNITDSKAQV